VELRNKYDENYSNIAGLLKNEEKHLTQPKLKPSRPSTAQSRSKQEPKLDKDVYLGLKDKEYRPTTADSDSNSRSKTRPQSASSTNSLAKDSFRHSDEEAEMS
jgi:hypothetical protein